MFAAKGGGHTGEVADRGHRGAEASAERLAARRAAEVVVAAAGALGFGDDLQLARAGAKLEHWPAGEVTVIRRERASGVRKGVRCIPR